MSAAMITRCKPLTLNTPNSSKQKTTTPSMDVSHEAWTQDKNANPEAQETALLNSLELQKAMKSKWFSLHNQFKLTFPFSPYNMELWWKRGLYYWFIHQLGLYDQNEPITKHTNF